MAAKGARKWGVRGHGVSWWGCHSKLTTHPVVATTSTSTSISNMRLITNCLHLMKRAAHRQAPPGHKQCEFSCKFLQCALTYSHERRECRRVRGLVATHCVDVSVPAAAWCARAAPRLRRTCPGRRAAQRAACRRHARRRARRARRRARRGAPFHARERVEQGRAERDRKFSRIADRRRSLSVGVAASHWGALLQAPDHEPHAHGPSHLHGGEIAVPRLRAGADAVRRGARERHGGTR